MAKRFDRQTATFLAVVAQNMPSLTNKEMQYWIGNPAEVKKVTVGFQRTKPTNSCLRFKAKHNLPAINEPVDAEAYFKTRDGLYVWDGFKNRFLTAAVETKPAPDLTIDSYDLVRLADDNLIQTELSSGHVFKDTGEFLTVLAGMIERQWRGKEVLLLTNGSANIFYVWVAGEVITVYVNYAGVGRLWHVGCYLLGDNWWVVGGLVFARTAVA